MFMATVKFHVMFGQLKFHACKGSIIILLCCSVHFSMFTVVLLQHMQTQSVVFCNCCMLNGGMHKCIHSLKTLC